MRTCCTACDLFIHRDVGCIFTQCDNGRCCCSTKITLVPGETLQATVWRGGDSVGSKKISVTETCKLTWLEILKSTATRIRFVLIHAYWETLIPRPSSPTVKPRVPKIDSVNESNGNFLVMWKSNMEADKDIDESLTSTVTYYKKGDPEKVGAMF